MITAVQAADLCDVSYRQMDHWIRKGYVKTQERRKEKSGFERLIDEREFDVLTVFVCLVNAGLPPRVATGLVRGDFISLAALEEALCGCRRVLGGEVSA
jgi:hypothetical protein